MARWRFCAARAVPRESPEAPQRRPQQRPITCAETPELLRHFCRRQAELWDCRRTESICVQYDGLARPGGRARSRIERGGADQASVEIRGARRGGRGARVDRGVVRGRVQFRRSERPRGAVVDLGTDHDVRLAAVARLMQVLGAATASRLRDRLSLASPPPSRRSRTSSQLRCGNSSRSSLASRGRECRRDRGAAQVATDARSARQRAQASGARRIMMRTTHGFPKLA